MIQGMILVLVIAAMGGGAFGVVWWRRSRRTSTRALAALVVTEDMRIVPGSFPVELGYAVKHSWRQAWIVAPECLIRQRDTHVSWLIADERDALPQAITQAAGKAREKYEKENDHGIPSEICRVGRQRGMDAVTRKVSEQNKENTHALLKTVVYGVLVMFGILTLLAFGLNRC